MEFIEKFKSVLPSDVVFDELYDLAPADLWKTDPRKAGVLALERAEIFDCDAYLEKYPDVRDAGDDPIEHYAMHGIDEGRTISIKIRKKTKYINKIIKYCEDVEIDGMNKVLNDISINIVNMYVNINNQKFLIKTSFSGYKSSISLYDESNDLFLRHSNAKILKNKYKNDYLFFNDSSFYVKNYGKILMFFSYFNSRLSNYFIVVSDGAIKLDKYYTNNIYQFKLLNN